MRRTQMQNEIGCFVPNPYSRWSVCWLSLCVAFLSHVLQLKVYDEDTEEARHRKEEIGALGADNPTAVYA
jgi:hypothetical protein